jgi:hypothetical protein
MMGFQSAPAQLFHDFCLTACGSRADDAHAHHWLLHGHPLGAAQCEEVHLDMAYRWFCRLSRR